MSQADLKLSQRVDSSPDTVTTITACHSSTMATFQAALDALKKAVSNAKTSKEVKATFDRVSTSLILLVGPVDITPT
jgi:hypothetical protein